MFSPTKHLVNEIFSGLALEMFDIVAFFCLTILYRFGY
jgi:hypothetical protein